MRSRLIVAIAALMAAAALVALPEPAGSRAPSSARPIEPTSLSALAIPLSAGSPAMTIPVTDTALRSAGWLGPGSLFLEPGNRQAPKPPRRRALQPEPRIGVVLKNPWRYDPNVSWYGTGFIGSGTACGQRYTRTIMGVAHRMLPCGTLITFRNPANGRQVTVPVIDRGPYVAGRQWDLSRGLCDFLRHCYTGAIEWKYARH